MRSHNVGRAVPAIVIAALWLAGCGPAADRGPDLSNNRSEDLASVREPVETGLEGLDFGDDWFQMPGDVTPDASGVSTSTKSEGGTSYWAIVLGTFSGDDHARSAQTMIRSCTAIDPRLGQAHLFTSGKGSLVLFGAYESATAEDAQRDLEWVKSLRYGNRLVFGRAMLSRVDPARARGLFRPNELVSVRLEYPELHPLYTLQVAVWGDFGSGTLSLEQIRRRAEEHVRSLRAQGFEAYFHHDDDLRLSMVTVGLFDHTAIDLQSGLMAPEVEILLKRFPAHLVNGEPIEEPIDSRRIELGTRTQTPKLVLVPQL